MRRRTIWSRQSPLSPSRTASSKAIGVNENGRKTKKRKLNSESTTTPSATVLATPQADYFPASCLHMFGPLPIPPSSVTDKEENENGDGVAPAVILPKDHEFPHNVSFRHSDWPAQPIPEDAEGYDVVIAYVIYYLSFLTPIALHRMFQCLLSFPDHIRFSVTKWIHLNTGDAGLERFFRRVHTTLRKGGTFVLEPQGWESYTKARKLDPVRSYLLTLHSTLFSLVASKDHPVSLYSVSPITRTVTDPIIGYPSVALRFYKRTRRISNFGQKPLECY